jgi:hypothetical protein
MDLHKNLMNSNELRKQATYSKMSTSSSKIMLYSVLLTSSDIQTTPRSGMYAHPAIAATIVHVFFKQTGLEFKVNATNEK